MENNLDIDTVPSIDTFIELDEQELLGDKVHLVCCKSDVLCLCGYISTGNYKPKSTPLTCVECVEIEVASSTVRCAFGECLVKNNNPNEPD